jgi:CheY-like chemotaxis protein
MTAKADKLRTDALQYAFASSKDLLSVLNTILDISNIESGKLVLSNSPFTLGKVVFEINNLIYSLCKAKGIFWEPQVEKITNVLTLELDGDRIKLMQVLTIMLRSAVKYASEEQGKVIFKIEPLEETDKAVLLRFEVSDNGIGMTAKKTDELMQMFSSNNNDVHYSSEEIMLSVCNNIVNAMGGQIQFESKPGLGTFFSFSLKFSKAIMPVQPEKEIKLDKLDFTGKKVLVVDDVAVNREVLINILSTVGIEVIEARDGQDAYETFLMQSTNIDLLLMDIMMPIMDGYEATKKIRASGMPYARSVPIIAVTTLNYKEDKDAATNAGMNFHIEKPVEPEILLSAISRFFSNKN